MPAAMRLHCLQRRSIVCMLIRSALVKAALEGRAINVESDWYRRYEGSTVYHQRTGCLPGMKYESGVHRVQRVPETESGGRIHTSTISVAVMPEVDDDIDIIDKDIRIDVMRASGNGGQWCQHHRLRSTSDPLSFRNRGIQSD